jgi:hypothetical protein
MISTKKFYRNKENFICEVCSAFIQGNGYTNHCSVCFYSKHVDINPGDRAAKCKGLMKPISYNKDSKKGLILIHKCLKCGEYKSNKLANTDSIENLLNAFR